MFLYACISLLIVIVLIVILCAIINTKINMHIWLLVLLIVVGCLAYIAFCFNAGTYNSDNWVNVYYNSTFDVVRYHIEINALRGVDFELVKTKIYSAQEPMRILLFYILAQFNSDNWISVVSVVLTFGVFSRLVYQFGFCFPLEFHNGKVKKMKSVGIRELVLAYLILFAAVDYMDMVNTCRGIIAYSLISYAIVQLYVYDRKIISYILIVIASMLHVSGWGIFLIILCVRVLPVIYKFRYFFLFWQLALFPISLLLSLIPFRPFQVISIRLQNYVGAIGGMWSYWAILMISFILFTVMIQYLLGKTRNSRKREMLKLIQVILFIMIGGYRTIIALRLFYIIGIISPVFIFAFYEKIHFKYKQLLMGAMVICLTGCCIYHIGLYSVYINQAGATWG